MDIIQMCESFGSLLGIIAFILYFPVKKGILKAREENDNINNLKEVINGLKEERTDLWDRIHKLEAEQKHLNEMNTFFDLNINMDKMAFNSVILCEHRKDCPIIKKREELNNGKK